MYQKFILGAFEKVPVIKIIRLYKIFIINSLHGRKQGIKRVIINKSKPKIIKNEIKGEIKILEIIPIG